MHKLSALLILGLALLAMYSAHAAEVLLPQNRVAFYSDEPIEFAVAGLNKGETSKLELTPDKGASTLSFAVQGDGSTMLAVLPPNALAPGAYSVRLDGKDASKISVASGVLASTMLTSQSSGGMKEAGADFILGNAFSFGQMDANGQPLVAGLRGRRSLGLNAFDRAITQDLPTIVYMYWTGFVTHKPWGSEKSWANADMSRDMRLFNLHTAQYLRRYDRNIISVGTLDEPGLSWGKTPSGGMASGFPNWDEARWYEARGWKYTQDISAGSDADWMKYMTIRAAIMKEQNAQAKADLKSIWPDMIFSTDIYAPSAIMDGTDPLNQQVNDIPSSHVFMDWGTGKAGVVGAIYLEKAHDPTSKLAHAMNGQLFNSLVPQPQQTYAYHAMMNGMLAAGLHSNWWLNTGNMQAADLKAVNIPAQRMGPVFQNMTPKADTAILWSFTEAAMRQKDMAVKESKKKDGEQIKLMIASWPDTNDAAGTAEQSVNAYNIGGNYKEQILNTHQAVNRAGYPAHILHEKILASEVLRNYKTLVIVGQTFALPADVQKQIADFQKRGGRVVTDNTTTIKIPNAITTTANFRDPAYRWGGVFVINNPKVSAKQASLYQTNFFMDQQARDAAPLMKSTLGKTQSLPVFSSDVSWLVGERHVGGEGQMMMVLNAYEKLPDIKDTERYEIYNYSPFNASLALQGIGKTDVVYEISGLDWTKARRLSTPNAVQNVSFEPGEMKLYLVAPRAPAGLALKAQSMGNRLQVHATLGTLKMPWPLQVTIKDASGQTLFQVYRATDAKGEYSETFPLGANAAAGKYTVSVDGLAEPQKVRAQAAVAVAANTITPKMLSDAVRVFDANTIQKFLAVKPKVVIVAGYDPQQAAAQKLARGLAAQGIKAEVKPSAAVLSKVLYPRVWNPYATYYAATGEAKLPADADVKTHIVIVAKTDGSFSAKDENGKEWGGDWKQPNSLVTVGGDGFVDYMNQDSESVFEAGVQLYFNKDRAMTLVKGAMKPVQTTEKFKAKWSRPWSTLSTYVGGIQLPPQLPEAYTTSDHLVLLGDSGSNQAVAVLQASELLPQIVDEKYPGAGKALIQFAWSPFALEKNAILIGASDAAGIDAGVNKLLEMARRP